MSLVGLRDGAFTRALLARGGVQADFLETGGPLAATAVPGLPGVPRVIVHNALWNWSLAHPKALEVPGALATMRETIARTRAPWHSVHLGFASAEVAAEGPMMVPRSPVLGRDALLAAIAGNARALARAVPARLLLENLDYWPSGAYDHVSDPAFIAEVLEDADAGFLLDIAHARVAAAHLRMPVDEYLSRLPLARVRELHVSGPRPRDGVLTDAHETLSEEDYRLVAAVLRVVRPAAVTFEYGGADAGAVAAELTRLRTVLVT
jgi:uncharacterized protein (UPF0276 family)